MISGFTGMHTKLSYLMLLHHSDYESGVEALRAGDISAFIGAWASLEYAASMAPCNVMMVSPDTVMGLLHAVHVIHYKPCNQPSSVTPFLSLHVFSTFPVSLSFCRHLVTHLAFTKHNSSPTLCPHSPASPPPASHLPASHLPASHHISLPAAGGLPLWSW